MRKEYYDTATQGEDDEEEEYSGPSKSQRKRDAEALQSLGRELTTLSTDQLERIDLPENIRVAIDDFKKIKSFGAQRRQLQLIGRYMRQLDGNAVKEAILRAKGESRVAVAAHHRAEKLRDALIANDAALTALFEKQPQLDIQKIRQLVRSARREANDAKPPKSARELYKLLYGNELPKLDLNAKEDDEEMN